MKVTLLSLCRAKGFTPFEILKVKRELIGYQKSGKMFTNANVSSLDTTDEFDIYFYAVPSKMGDKDAFPVPANYFQIHKNEHDQYLYMKEYFEMYYEGEVFPKGELEAYKAHKPHVGEEFVWYYKRTADFS